MKNCMKQIKKITISQLKRDSNPEGTYKNSLQKQQS